MPTQAELRSMEFVYEASPYVGQTNSNININNFDWVYEGAPFIISQATTSAAAEQVIIITIW